MRLKTICLLCIVPILFFSCEKEEKQARLAPPDIPVFQTKAREVPVYREFVGQIYGFKDIAIRARVEGYLEGIHFEEGSRIQKDKLLYMLESQPFEADVAAKMSRVAEAKTTLAYAESDLNRIKPLAEMNAVSQSDLDGAVALYEASVASLDAAKANLRAAEIQLSYTKIHSPVSGIIGKTRAKVGDFVGREPNPVILNTVSRIDTILVQFFITESEYLKYARDRFAREDAPDPEKREGDMALILADGSMYEHRGKGDFVDREVDPTTGAMLVQASFPNPQELLRPGQFARVKVRIGVVEDGILVPQRCISELQGLYSVFVVDAGNKVQKREVKTGTTIRDFWLVTEGLKQGEKIVYEGLQKVKDGAIVNPVVQEIELPDRESM